MNPQEHLPALRAMASRMLPGFRQAQAQLNAAVRVLEYFEQHAQWEQARTTSKHPARAAADPALLEHIEQLQAMMQVYRRLQAPHS